MASFHWACSLATAIPANETEDENLDGTEPVESKAPALAAELCMVQLAWRLFTFNWISFKRVFLRAQNASFILKQLI